MAKKKPDIQREYETGLAEFVCSTQSNWQSNRDTLQSKWQRNSEAYRRISSGFWKSKETQGWRSNTFVNITKQKVLAAYALVVDTLLAANKIPFMLKPAPWEDANFEDFPEARDDVEGSINNMRYRIDQQLLESHAAKELCKNILSAAIYGETYQKDIVHEMEYSHYVQVMPELPEGVTDISGVPAELMSWDITRSKRNAPGTIEIPVWDIFRDMETDDLQKSAGVVHRQLVSPYWLRKKKGKRFFINSSIDTVLSKQADSTNVNGKTPDATSDSLSPAERDIKYRQNAITYLEFWGRAKRSIVEDYESHRAAAEGKKAPKQKDRASDTDYGDEVEVLIAVAEKQIVRYTRRPEGMRPFRRCEWEDNLDAVGGVGVADNAEDMQLVLNGAMRAFEDNKKLSGNLVGGIKADLIEEDVNEFRPGDFFHVSPEAEGGVGDAISFANIPDVGETLLSLISLAQQFADMETMIPKIEQGMETKHELTAFEISQQIEKAGKYLGAVIRNFDEFLIEPMITAYYKYNMRDPNVEKGKGDYLVKALGFSSFQNRVERITKMQQMLALILSNEALTRETKVRWYLEELHKAADLDPDQALKSEEEKQADAEQAQNSTDTQLAIAAQQASIQRTNAQANVASSKAKATDDQVVIDRAKAVSEIEAGQSKAETDRIKAVTPKQGGQE